MRERRIMLGLTRQRMAQLIGVSSQQAYKYEKGINGLAAARLYAIAEVLDVEVRYFFEGLQSGVPPFSPAQRLLADLAGDYLNITDPRHREAISALARALAPGGK